MNEMTFLKKFAVNKFNEQYGKNIPYNYFCIRSIEPSYDSKLGYELISLITTDNLKLRIYLDIREHNEIRNYRVENIINTEGKETLLDEVYVAMGSIGSNFMEVNDFKFEWLIGDCIYNTYHLLMENGDKIREEDGEGLFLQERADNQNDDITNT